MKKLLFIFFLLATSILSAQEVENSAFAVMLKGLLDHSVPEVNAKNVDPSQVVLLDAREKREYEISHIDGAIWVGYDDFQMDRVKAIPKDKKVVVYCSVGYRSEKVSEKLIKAGYQDVSNMYGGIFEWVNQQGPVVDNSGKDTKNVHAYDKTWGVWLRKGKKCYK